MACMLFPLLLLLSSGPVAARKEDVPQEWSWKEYPHPMVDTEGCGRRDQASLICDPNLILKYEQGNNESLPYYAFYPLCRLTEARTCEGFRVTTECIKTDTRAKIRLLESFI